LVGALRLEKVILYPYVEKYGTNASAAKSVDRIVIGDWNTVQVALGLKSAEEVALMVSKMPSKIKRGVGHKNIKSKVAKQSRKKNRNQ